jgi:hypothetical protein
MGAPTLSGAKRSVTDPPATDRKAAPAAPVRNRPIKNETGGDGQSRLGAMSSRARTSVVGEGDHDVPDDKECVGDSILESHDISDGLAKREVYSQ